MTPRRSIAVVMILVALISRCAIAQNAPSGEPANAAERALVGAQPDAWARLNPQQRERVLEDFRPWQRMTPGQRQGGRTQLSGIPQAPSPGTATGATHVASVP